MIAGLVLAADLMPAQAVAQATVTEATKPNILLINTDDQRWDTMRVMPETLGWLKDARTFDRATVTIPSCCPSRASLFSGRYRTTTGCATRTTRRTWT